jgi:ribosomal protein S18 acetylase RimI-like enzyme
MAEVEGSVNPSIEIRPLTTLCVEDLARLISGYTSNAKYIVSKMEAADQFEVKLDLVQLQPPYVKRYDPLDADAVEQYLQISRNEFSFGAFDDGQCMGIALAEPHHWNSSLRILELHVAASHKGKDIGRGLLNAITHRALDANLRILVCETQNTNVPAIDFYRKLGFSIEAIDLSLYSNEDFPDGEIAVIMKKQL